MKKGRPPAAYTFSVPPGERSGRFVPCYDEKARRRLPVRAAATRESFPFEVNSSCL